MSLTFLLLIINPKWFHLTFLSAQVLLFNICAFMSFYQHYLFYDNPVSSSSPAPIFGIALPSWLVDDKNSIWVCILQLYVRMSGQSMGCDHGLSNYIPGVELAG